MDSYIDKDGWEYGRNKSGQLFINPPIGKRQPVPKTLNKYYSLNEYSIEVLEKLEIYVSYPDKMNDPWDTDASLIKVDDFSFVQKIFGPLNSPNIKDYFRDDKDLINKAPWYYRNLIYSFLGIFSMTKKHTNLLMWSYYNNHKGFCIEFDYHNFPFEFHGPFQMNYKEKFRPVPISYGEEIANLYQISTKAINWAHEDEWRILPVANPNKPFKLDGHPLFDTGGEFDHWESRLKPINKENIKTLILGVNFFDHKREFIQQSDDNMIIVKLNKQPLKSRLLDKVIEYKINTILLGKQRGKFAFRETPVRIIKTEDFTYKIDIMN